VTQSGSAHYPFCPAPDNGRLSGDFCSLPSLASELRGEAAQKWSVITYRPSSWRLLISHLPRLPL